MGKRCLITGVTGFVGSHLADYLLSETDWEIHGMLRWRSPLDNVQGLLGEANSADGRVKFHYADLRDDAAVRKCVVNAAPYYVFHLAAQSYPKVSFASPCDTLETNVQGTVRLLSALREFAPEALIHVCSSSEVYGRVPKERLPIREDCPFHPASPYAVSKVGADLMAQHYAMAYGMRIMVTRMGTHTGARRGDVFAESTFAKQIAMVEAGQIPPVIKHGNLDSLRTIADVRDAVRAYHLLLTINPQGGEVYNIAGDHECMVSDILRDLLSMSGTRATLEPDPERMRPIDADNQIFDTTKFRNHSGWKPEISYEKTLSDLLSYWRVRVKTMSFLGR